MTYIVYADVMLLWNIIINIVVLSAASKILHISINLRHILLWSTLMGAITLAEYLLTLRQNKLVHHILYAGIYFLMTMLYFRRHAIRHILVHIFTIIITMNILYGIVHVFCQYFYITDLSVIPKVIFGLFIIFTAATLLESHTHSSSNEYRLSMRLGDRNTESIGYMDSGNFLSDCYNGNPVIILDYRTASRLIGGSADKYMYSYHLTGNFDYTSVARLCGVNIYPLPYRTLSSEFATMPAICISELTFTDIGKTFSHITAGISRNKLINKNDYGVLLNESLKPDREEYSND